MSATHDTLMIAAHELARPALRNGFNFEALHAYTDHAGQALFWRIRAKNPLTGEKWIRPMKLGADGYVIGEPDADSMPGGKPLYRLHELAARPDDPIIITEGEYKADKLAALGLVVTTSGSAGSAGTTNWSPLAGRKLLIWPDNDAAGSRYADAVIAAVWNLTCDVHLLRLDQLKLPEKGDAVDWLDRHPNASAADVLALDWMDTLDPTFRPDLDGGLPDKAAEAATVNSLVQRPNSCKFGSGRFELNPGGVFFVDTDKEGEDKPPVWICSPLGVIAKTRDTKSGEWGRLLEWYDDDGVRHEWPMPLELLEGEGLEVRRELARRGLHIASSMTARGLLTSYIKAWPVDERARCVERLGWHGSAFVTPAETFGGDNERVVFQSAQALEPALAAVGSVDAWRDSVATLAVGNSRLVFALSVAFAGPLADIVGEDSGGFHIRGKSSSGKSTALKAAASVWGNPSSFVRVWRSTANGLEGLAAIHNDCLLILDELSQCDPREAGESAYLLANGQGKARASRNGTARASQCWRVLFLSAGEETLSALMARVGRKANAGQELRLADFDADAGAGMGAFEQLNGQSTPAGLALALKDAATKAHGAVGVAWLRYVVKDRASLVDLIEDGLRQFAAEVVPRGASGQIERVARRFALVAVAGELATHYGLTGWSEGESERAAKSCFLSWLDGFGGIGNREERAALAQVRAFFEAHGASRFESMSAADDQRVINRAGFYRQHPTLKYREYLVLPEAFKSDICKGLDAKAVERLLVANGWIVPGGDGRVMQKPRLPGIGTSVRVYVFSSKMWEGEW